MVISVKTELKPFSVIERENPYANIFKLYLHPKKTFSIYKLCAHSKQVPCVSQFLKKKNLGYSG